MMPDRRYDSITRTELMPLLANLDRKMDQLSDYQREANSKMATAYEKLATLEERTQNMKDAPARITGVLSIGIAFVAFLLNILRSQ